MSLTQLCSQPILNSTRPIFFMDNASIHKSKIYMNEIFSKYTLFTMHLTVTQLNPREYCFSQIKSQVRKLRIKVNQV